MIFTLIHELEQAQKGGGSAELYDSKDHLESDQTDSQLQHDSFKEILVHSVGCCLKPNLQPSIEQSAPNFGQINYLELKQPKPRKQSNEQYPGSVFT